MPRDVNGNYSLPAGNPVQSGTLIESSWANGTAGDLATEMTDSLSRSGKGGLTGPLGVVDLSGAVPGLNFINEPTSGLKRVAGGDVRMQVLGGDRMRWRSGAAQRPEVQVDAAWHSVAIEPADRKVMYGEGGVTTTFFYGTTAPPGWTIVAPDTNVRSLVVGPAAGGGVIGGAQDPINLAVSADMSGGTIAPAGNHNHTGSTQIAPEMVDCDQQAAGPEVSRSGHVHDLSINLGGEHSHTLTGNAVQTLTPYYARGLLAVLDA